MLASVLVGTAIAGAPPRWSDDAFPITYWVGADLGAAGLDDDAVLPAIGRAFEVWQAVDCLDASFVRSEKRVKDAAFGGADQRNTVFFVVKDWPTEYAGLPTAVELVTDENEILEGDIGLNAAEFQFAVEGDGIVAFDIQSTVTHAVGLLLGLEESSVKGATMNPEMVGRPGGQDLAQSDLDAICDLYAPTMDTGIPARSEQGDPCTRSEDCTDGFTCVVDNGDEYCAARCGGDGECGSGTTCKDPGSGSPVCIVERATGCGVAPRTSVFAVLLVAVALRGRRR